MGNPLIYIDPFGTNPKSLLTTLGHSILNVVGFIPGVGDMADLINAAWYAAEGNTKEALTCLISAVPFVGSTIGNTIRIASKGAKWALKAAKYVEAISNIAAGAATLYRTAGSATERAINLFDKYVVKKEKFDGKGAMEVMGLVVDTVGCVLSGKQMKNGIGALSKQMRLDKQIKFAMDGYSLADADPYDMMAKAGVPATLDGSTRSTTALNMAREGGGASDLDGIRIINKKYAGKTYELGGGLETKYSSGVKFSSEGFPDFEPYSIKKVTVNNLEGDAYYDFIKANEVAGYPSTPTGYTWHHVEDGRTMILVPSDLHGAVRHTGGASLIRKGVRP